MNYLKIIFKKYFLAGLIVLLPLVLTLWIFFYLIFTLDELVKPFIQLFIPNKLNVLPFAIHGYGIILAVVVTILVGFIARNFIGQYIIRVYEKIITKLPIIPKIYSSIKQITNTVMGSEKNAYNGVAIVEFPRKGMYTLALITSKPHKAFQIAIGSDNLVSLFVPTTPNPTSGYYVMVKEEEIKRLDMSVEMALKIIVSCGIIQEP